MIRLLVVSAILLAVGAPVSAMAQDAVCSSPVTMAFAGLPARRADILPSVHRQLSSIGRTAAVNGCAITVTCVAAADADAAGITARNRQCLAVAQAIVRYESRTAVRTALQSEITQAKETATGSLVAGTIYVTRK